MQCQLWLIENITGDNIFQFHYVDIGHIGLRKKSITFSHEFTMILYQEGVNMVHRQLNRTGQSVQCRNIGIHNVYIYAILYKFNGNTLVLDKSYKII